MTRCYIVVKYLQPATSIQGREAVTRPSPCLWKALLAACQHRLRVEDFFLMSTLPGDGSLAGHKVVASQEPNIPPDICQRFLALPLPEQLEWIKKMHAFANVRNLTKFSRSSTNVAFLQCVTGEWSRRCCLNMEYYTEEGIEPHITAFISAWRQLRDLMVKEVPGFAWLNKCAAAPQNPSLLKSEQTRQLVKPLWRPFEDQVPLPVPVPVPKIAQTLPTPVASTAGRTRQLPKATIRKNKAIVTGIGGGQRTGTSRGEPQAGAKPKQEGIICEECPYEELKGSLDINFQLLSKAHYDGYAEWQTRVPGVVNDIKAIWLGQKLRNGVFRSMRALISSAKRNPTAPKIEAANTSTKSQAPETEAPVEAATLNSAPLEALPCYLADDVKATLKEVIRLDKTKELLTLCRGKPLANDINVFKKLSDQLKPKQFHINSDECLKALRKACEACVWRQPAPESHTAAPTSEPQSFKRRRVNGIVRGKDKSVLVGLKSCTPTQCKHLDAEKWMWDFLCQLRSAFPDLIESTESKPSKRKPRKNKKRVSARPGIVKDCPFGLASAKEQEALGNTDVFSQTQKSAYTKSALMKKEGLLPAVWRSPDMRAYAFTEFRKWLVGKLESSKENDALKQEALKKGVADERARVEGAKSTVESKDKNATEKPIRKALSTHTNALLGEVFDKIVTYKDNIEGLVEYRQKNPLANDLCIILSLAPNLDGLCLDPINIAPSQQCIWFHKDSEALPRAKASVRSKMNLQVIFGLESCNASYCKHIDADHWGLEFLCQLGRAFPQTHSARKRKKGTKDGDGEPGTAGEPDDGGGPAPKRKRKPAQKKKNKE